MSTIYKWMDTETAVTGSDVAADDLVLMYDASSKTVKKAAITDIQCGGVVATTAGATTLAVSASSHNGRVIVLNNTAPIAITLPQATGTGNRYRFQLQVAATGTASTISVGNGTDVMQGIMFLLTTSSDNVIGFTTSATSDRISFNGTTQGGVAGAVYEVVDVKTGFFSVRGESPATGTYATPFSASVT